MNTIWHVHMYTHSQTHSHTLVIELLDEYLFGVLSSVQRDDGVRKVGRLDVPDAVFGRTVRPTSWPWPTYGGSYGARSGPRCDSR
jgi:hypothetical protein